MLGLTKLQIAHVNLTFSSLSSIASLAAVTLILASFRAQPIPLRGNLILLLVFSNWLNATNNALGNFWVNVGGNPGLDGPACIANGFIGQLTVQIGDLTTLAIAVLVYSVLNSKNPTGLQERYKRYFPFLVWGICFLGFTTATVGYLINGFQWLGSWCWFSSKNPATATAVRYALTHGPRIVIFIILVVLYVRLFLQLKVYATTRFLDEEESKIRPPSYSSYQEV